MKKYTKEELYKMDAVDVYKMVLKGDIIKKFPNGFWQQPEALNNAIKCTKFLIEDILKLTDEELKTQLSQNIFKKNKLSGMLQICFKDSPIQAILETYPDKNFKPWEFKIVPQGYWNKKTGMEATRWLIEEHLKLGDEQVKKQLNRKMFEDNGFQAMLNICFECSPIKAILETYPEKNFMPWEFDTQVPRDYWTKENGINSVKWLVETKLQLNDEELKEQLTVQLFIDNGLYGMLDACFGASPTRAILETYPEKNFKPWEFKCIPIAYWDKERGIEATRWLIDKLNLNDEELKEQLSQKLFNDNGLGSMLQYCFSNSPIRAILESFPEKKIKVWEFKKAPRGYWNEDTAIKSVRWLIETKLQLSDEDLKEQLSVKLFIENGLGGMIDLCFGYSPFKAIDKAYPNKFKKEDFKNYK